MTRWKRLLPAGQRIAANRLRLYYGGTGRSAIETFRLRPEREPVHVNPLVQAVFVPEDEGGAGRIDLMVNGPGYTDPESGHLHGYGRPGTLRERLATQVLGLGHGGMDQNAQAMLDAADAIRELLRASAQIDVFGYSRGAVSAARSLRELRSIFPWYFPRTRLFDPVAGPLDQRPESVHGTQTTVQYSLENVLPGFWATPILGARTIVLAQGGHATATRHNYGRFPDLDSLPAGVLIEERPSQLVSIGMEEALRRLRESHDSAYGYPESAVAASRYREIEQAVLQMAYRPVVGTSRGDGSSS